MGAHRPRGAILLQLTQRVLSQFKDSLGTVIPMNEQPPFDPQQNRPVPPPHFHGDQEDTAPLAADRPREAATPPKVVPGSTAPGSTAPGSPAAGSPAPAPQGPAPEHTAMLGQPWGPGPGDPAPGPRRKNRGAPVAIAAATVLLAAAAGFGGAALYDAIDDDSSSSSSSSANVIDQGTSPGGEGSVEAVADKVLPSVVQISVSGNSGSGTGSGIVLSEDGRILTNEHVVDGAGQGATIRVSFTDGTRANATVVGTDALTDIAVIQAQDVSGLTPATIGKSQNLKVGQEVVAIGAPFGLDATVTSGIVSALDRPVNVNSDAQGNSTTYPAIQTDAAINPGNSGGPLADMTGSVVGINSSIRTAGSSNGSDSGSIGLGFAIPMDEILPIVDQIVAGETPTHARLGINVSDSQESDEAVGALVRNVGQGSAAAKAGLKEGDLITKVDDEPIDSADDLVATIRSYRPGDKVTITHLRGSKPSTTSLVLDSDAKTGAS